MKQLFTPSRADLRNKRTVEHYFTTRPVWEQTMSAEIAITATYQKHNRKRNFGSFHRVMTYMINGIINNGRDTGIYRCRPSQPRIAHDNKMSVRTVGKMFALCKEEGYLYIRQPYHKGLDKHGKVEIVPETCIVELGPVACRLIKAKRSAELSHERALQCRERSKRQAVAKKTAKAERANQLRAQATAYANNQRELAAKDPSMGDVGVVWDKAYREEYRRLLDKLADQEKVEQEDLAEDNPLLKEPEVQELSTEELQANIAKVRKLQADMKAQKCRHKTYEIRENTGS